MSAIEYIKANFHKECLIPDQTDDLCIHAILELDAMFKEHINKYHFIQFPPKTGPVLNEGKGRFDPDTHLPYGTTITEEEHYDILHEGLKHMAGIDAKPTPTDDKYCTCEGEKITWFDRSQTTNEQGKILQDMCDRCCTCGKEIKPSYNAETIKAMEDVKEGKNIITIPLDELFDEDCGKEAKPTDEDYCTCGGQPWDHRVLVHAICEDCGKEKQPTDEELVEKYKELIITWHDGLAYSPPLGAILRQLIAEVRR